jgi:hypothetical protein
MRPMTGFGQTVWELATRRGIVNQRELAQLIEEKNGEKVSYYLVRNYLQGRSVVHPRFPRQLAVALDLSKGEKMELARAFTFGQDRGCNT